MSDRSPFLENTDAHELALALGFEVVRAYRAIDVYDDEALAKQGFISSKPKLDFAKIARALEAGQTVEGARWKGTEYVLRAAKRQVSA